MSFVVFVSDVKLLLGVQNGVRESCAVTFRASVSDECKPQRGVLYRSLSALKVELREKAGSESLQSDIAWFRSRRESSTKSATA
jgi:hypothetical protein